MTTPKSKSVARAASSALKKDSKARDTAIKKSSVTDSFVNFGANMGMGADNPMSGSTYGFNPITRNRTLLEWIHRGSWLGGVAVDVVADDMTRTGVEHLGSMPPEDIETIDEAAQAMGVMSKVNETIKWSRLYGGAIAVLLIDGQDTATPLRLNTIRKGQFRGLLVLDRWMVEPSLNDLVTEMGPDMGKPKFYHVVATAPGLSKRTIHHTRCVRLEGTALPYWQSLMENMWGISIFERLYDRMVAFDSATTGAAQLVYKAHLRTYKIKGMREVVATGGTAMEGLVKYAELMRRYQTSEGLTMIDGEDEFSSETHGAFGGLSDALMQFAQQLSGALQIPLVRLFGQSPAGFSTGETDLRNYYDLINQLQERDLRQGLTKIYRCIAASEGIELPAGYKIAFPSLWKPTDEQKATIAGSVATAVTQAESSNLITQAGAMKELKQSSRVTGIFTNITEQDIEDAEQSGPPSGENLFGEKKDNDPEQSDTVALENTGQSDETIDELKKTLARVADAIAKIEQNVSHP